MPKFHVGVREVHVSTREVEATSPEEALEKAGEIDLSHEIMCEYSHTLDKEHWSVEEINEAQSGS